ncbi:MAG TPA: YqgE/AlgH family protein [Alphaproteobacteria bacterium]|jgi:putative transcriptional regulator|nr:YqgE/AlgH family protein [Alphaproteobacteria bacterium]
MSFLMSAFASDNAPTWLNGQLLIAMPGMSDPRFGRTVLYICTHSSEGAMGLVINRAFGEIRFNDLMSQLGIEGAIDEDRPVHFGGPVDSSRGFVLHSADFRVDQTLVIDDHVALTATRDILQAIVTGNGPGNAIFALGYAKWFPGQLDSEIQANEWLTAPADAAIIFDRKLDTKWERAIALLGFDPAMLSGSAGHA